MGVTAGIFLASILLKEMRYLVYIRYLWGKLPQEMYIINITEYSFANVELCMLAVNYFDVSFSINPQLNHLVLMDDSSYRRNFDLDKKNEIIILERAS
jgi:hypothetical protein